jgi:hypothetical protein
MAGSGGVISFKLGNEDIVCERSVEADARVTHLADQANVISRNTADDSVLTESKFAKAYTHIGT